MMLNKYSPHINPQTLLCCSCTRNQDRPSPASRLLVAYAEPSCRLTLTGLATTPAVVRWQRAYAAHCCQNHSCTRTRRASPSSSRPASLDSLQTTSDCHIPTSPNEPHLNNGEPCLLQSHLLDTIAAHVCQPVVPFASFGALCNITYTPTTLLPTVNVRRSLCICYYEISIFLLSPAHSLHVQCLQCRYCIWQLANSSTSSAQDASALPCTHRVRLTPLPRVARLKRLVPWVSVPDIFQDYPRFDDLVAQPPFAPDMCSDQNSIDAAKIRRQP